ncbi:VOC family protein [Corallococcus sp. H22C18031201]|uniref:VOC family protein n=1 Tax=Citreicoccus inhibens TaxID=2849499 RepID=UPI000E71076A|nr:VOC family protein [Citreicoccus inhibens]MBU8900097.1 VOC family protein [Citreicoccus inhibens]RJS20876.1 VOC family protein [Corallococcus sp. H22C18031201]
MSSASQQAAQHHRIDYIEFNVTDLAATKRFYSTVFGWSFEDYGPAYSAFNDGRLSGGFTTDGAVTPGGPLIVLYSRDLEATLDRVRKAGGVITKNIFSFPGGRRFEFTDPSGHRLAVWTEP